MSKVVPLEHANGSVPHNLLGSGHSLCVKLWALWTTVQTLHIKMTRKVSSENCLQEDKISELQTIEHWVFLTIQPAGIPSATDAVPVVAFSSNLSAVIKSTGSVIFTPFFSALAMRSFTIVEPSSSNREVPIWVQKDNNFKKRVEKHTQIRLWISNL